MSNTKNKINYLFIKYFCFTDLFNRWYCQMIFYWIIISRYLWFFFFLWIFSFLGKVKYKLICKNIGIYKLFHWSIWFWTFKLWFGSVQILKHVLLLSLILILCHNNIHGFTCANPNLYSYFHVSSFRRFLICRILCCYSAYVHCSWTVPQYLFLADIFRGSERS